MEVSTALFLIFFGLLTHYFIPFSLLFDNFGMFFFVMNFILTCLGAGMVLVSIMILFSMQKAILEIILCTCCRKDRGLKSLIITRMEAGQNRNNKIALMVTASIGFLILQTSSQ